MGIDISQPEFHGLGERGQIAAGKTGQEVGADGFEKSFNLAFALGFIGPGVDQGHAQGGADLLQMLGAKGRAIVGIELAGQAAGREGHLKGL